MLNASYTDPLSAAWQTTSQVVSTVAATNVTKGLTVAATPGSQYGRGSSSLGLGGSDVRSQLWSYAPVTDAFHAARLMAIYRYVVDSSASNWQRRKDSAEQLVKNYPLINAAVNYSENECLRDARGLPIKAENLTALGQLDAKSTVLQGAAAAAELQAIGAAIDAAIKNADAKAETEPKGPKHKAATEADQKSTAATEKAKAARSAADFASNAAKKADDADKDATHAHDVLRTADRNAAIAEHNFKINPSESNRLRVIDALAAAATAKKAADTADALAKATAALLLGNANSPELSLPSFSRCVTSVAVTSGPSMTQGNITYTNMRIDPYYTRGPVCVICTGDLKQADKWNENINENLTGGWLHWRALPNAPFSHLSDTYVDGDISLGIHDHYEFFVAQGQRITKMPQFGLFILAAATQSDTSTSGGGAAGAAVAAGGGKTGAQTPVNIISGGQALLGIAVPQQ